jgi:formamidopyrimidine-DNA glycosylase
LPELPEVETIARGLSRAITGKTIAAVDVRLPKVAIGNGVPFAQALPGERIASVGRRGKFVVIELASGRSLVVHLRMTGRLIVRPAAAPAYPYTNVAIAFSDRTGLCFADVRQFCRMRLVAPGEPWDAAVGVEPLSSAFTEEELGSMLHGRRTPIKVFLLDQRRIAGIGNIYACEALWTAGIRPSRPAGALTRPARSRLHGALRSVLELAIDMRGTSVDDYVDAEGVRGGFQNVLSVYGRAGQPCLHCKRPIVRTVLAQRGTWWCRACQR